MPFLRQVALFPLTFSPSNTTSPSSTVNTPDRIPARVVLPEPDSPINTTTSPERISRSQLSQALTVFPLNAKLLRMPLPIRSVAIPPRLQATLLSIDIYSSCGSFVLHSDTFWLHRS